VIAVLRLGGLANFMDLDALAGEADMRLDLSGVGDRYDGEGSRLGLAERTMGYH